MLTELRVLASKDLDSRQLLCVLLAGDGRLIERLRSPDLLPLGSRIQRRLVLDYASRDELLACLDHLLEVAGNPSLMTTELKATLADGRSVRCPPGSGPASPPGAWLHRQRDPKETTLFEAYYLWPNSEGDYSPEAALSARKGLRLSEVVLDLQPRRQPPVACDRRVGAGPPQSSTKDARSGYFQPLSSDPGLAGIGGSGVHPDRWEQWFPVHMGGHFRS